MSDRAYRYRANAYPPPGEKICAFCGSTRNVEVGHVDGHEENTSPENLTWTCRRCNTQMGAVFKRHGIGRRTHQYNPSRGAKSLGAWLAAVTSMKGQSNQMSIPDAVALIQATPPARRSEFARQIWALRREHGIDRRGEGTF